MSEPTIADAGPVWWAYLRRPLSPEVLRGGIPLAWRLDTWHPLTKDPKALEADNARAGLSRDAEATVKLQRHKVARARSDPQLLRKLWAENNACQWCGVVTHLRPSINGQSGQLDPDRATLDHLYPMYIRRTMPKDSDRNATVLSCYQCNQTRGDTPLEQWRKPYSPPPRTEQ